MPTSPDPLLEFCAASVWTLPLEFFPSIPWQPAKAATWWYNISYPAAISTVLTPEIHSAKHLIVYGDEDTCNAMHDYFHADGGKLQAGVFCRLGGRLQKSETTSTEHTAIHLIKEECVPQLRRHFCTNQKIRRQHREEGKLRPRGIRDEVLNFHILGAGCSLCCSR